MGTRRIPMKPSKAKAKVAPPRSTAPQPAPPTVQLGGKKMKIGKVKA